MCHNLFVFVPVTATDCALFVAHHCSLYSTPFISASLQTATYCTPEVNYFDSTLGIALILLALWTKFKFYITCLFQVVFAFLICSGYPTHFYVQLFKFFFVHELEMDMYTWPQLTATVGNAPFSPPLWYCLSCSCKLCLTSSVTPDLHCWEATSGERQTRMMAARAIGRVGSIVITCSSVLHNQFCIFSTVAKDCDVQVQLYTFILTKVRWTLASETTKYLIVLITEKSDWLI